MCDKKTCKLDTFDRLQRRERNESLNAIDRQLICSANAAVAARWPNDMVTISFKGCTQNLRAPFQFALANEYRFRAVVTG